MLRWRAATALVLAPIALASIALGKWAILAVLLVVIAGAAYELSRALEPLPFLAAFGAGALPLLLSIPYHQTGILAGALAGLPWALFWLAGKPEARTLRAVLAVLLMSLWVGAPLAHLGLFPHTRYGIVLILIAVVGPWISDAGAYFAGRFFGRHLLFPSLSPKKTIEGGVGGLLLTLLIVAPVAYLLLDRVDSLLFTAPAVYYISLLV